MAYFNYKIKASVVEVDPTETNQRRVLVLVQRELDKYAEFYHELRASLD